MTDIQNKVREEILEITKELDETRTMIRRMQRALGDLTDKVQRKTQYLEGLMFVEKELGDEQGESPLINEINKVLLETGNSMSPNEIAQELKVRGIATSNEEVRGTVYKNKHLFKRPAWGKYAASSPL